MTNTIHYTLPMRGLVRVDGNEATAFLDDLLTGNVAALPQGEAHPSALLTPQGRILFDLLIARDGDDDDAYLLETDSARIDDFIKKLTLYRLRRMAGIEKDPRPVSAVEGSDDGLKDSRFDIPVRRLYGEIAGESGDPDGFRRLRWQHGIPEGAGELPPEKALPLEARLDLGGGIDFDKGCYIGQEVTARTRYRGLVKRSYAPVRIAGKADAPCAILHDGREAGQILAAAADPEGENAMLGMASIRLEYLQDETKPLATESGIVITPFLPPRLLPLPSREKN